MNRVMNLSIPSRRAGSRRASFSNAGFSLVEVALAVAIAALAIITLLGLLPQGLEMSRKTSLLTTNSNILEQVIRNYENMQFTSLPSGLTLKYFTDQGLEVSATSKEISYVVQIDARFKAALPKAETEEPNLCRLVIKVATTSNTSFNFESPDTKMSYATFNHLIAKSR